MIAYAVETPNGLDMKTLYDTKRGAVANYLYTRMKINLTNAYTDEMIWALWEELRHPDARLMECSVVPISAVSTP